MFFFYNFHSHFSYLLFICMKEGDARGEGFIKSIFSFLQIHLKSIVVVSYCSDVFMFAPDFVFKVLFLICILLLHLFIVLYLYFHLKTFQIWFVGACCSAGSPMPLDSSSNTSLLSNTTINTNTNIVINCIFILICVCLRICIYISLLYLQSAGCQSAPKPHNIE